MDARDEMVFIPACGWCRHWGSGKGPLRLRHYFDDPYGESFVVIVADGLIQTCKVARLPDDALPCVRVCATSPLFGMGCAEFSFYG